MLAGIIGAVVVAGGSLAAFTLSQTSSDLRQQAYVAGPDGSGGGVIVGETGGDNTCGGTYKFKVFNGVQSTKCKTWERATNNGCQSDESCKMGVNQPCSDTVLCKSGLTCTPTSGSGKVCLAEVTNPAGGAQGGDPCQQLGTGWQQADLTCAAGQKKEDSRIDNSGVYCHRCVGKPTIKPGERCNDNQGCTCSTAANVTFGSKCPTSQAPAGSEIDTTDCCINPGQTQVEKKLTVSQCTQQGGVPRKCYKTNCYDYEKACGLITIYSSNTCDSNSSVSIPGGAGVKKTYPATSAGLTECQAAQQTGQSKCYGLIGDGNQSPYSCVLQPEYRLECDVNSRLFYSYPDCVKEKIELERKCYQITVTNNDPYCKEIQSASSQECLSGGNFTNRDTCFQEITVNDYVDCYEVYESGKDDYACREHFLPRATCINKGYFDIQDDCWSRIRQISRLYIGEGERCTAEAGCVCKSGFNTGQAIARDAFCLKSACDAISNLGLSEGQTNDYSCSSTGIRYKCKSFANLQSQNSYPFTSRWEMERCGSGELCQNGECVQETNKDLEISAKKPLDTEKEEDTPVKSGDKPTTAVPRTYPTPSPSPSPSSTPTPQPQPTPMSIEDAMNSAQPSPDLSNNQTCGSYDYTQNPLANHKGRVAEGTCEYRPSDNGTLHVCKSGTWMPVTDSKICEHTYVSPVRSGGSVTSSCGDYLAIECPTQSCRIEGGKCKDKIVTTTTGLTVDEESLPVDRNTPSTDDESDSTEQQNLVDQVLSTAGNVITTFWEFLGQPSPEVIVPADATPQRCSNDPKRQVSLNRLVENSSYCETGIGEQMVECNVGYEFKSVKMPLDFIVVPGASRCVLLPVSPSSPPQPAAQPITPDSPDSSSSYTSCAGYSVGDCPVERCNVEDNQCREIKQCSVLATTHSTSTHYLMSTLDSSGSVIARVQRCRVSESGEPTIGYVCKDGWTAAIVSGALLCYQPDELDLLCRVQTDVESCENYLGVCSFNTQNNTCRRAL